MINTLTDIDFYILYRFMYHISVFDRYGLYADIPTKARFPKN